MEEKSIHIPCESGIQFGDPITLLRRIRAKETGCDPDCPPDGFHTRNEWAKIWGMSDRTARGYLGRAVRAGMMEVQHFLSTSGQVTRPIPFYREVLVEKEG